MFRTIANISQTINVIKTMSFWHILNVSQLTSLLQSVLNMWLHCRIFSNVILKTVVLKRFAHTSEVEAQIVVVDIYFMCIVEEATLVGVMALVTIGGWLKKNSSTFVGLEWMKSPFMQVPTPRLGWLKIQDLFKLMNPLRAFWILEGFPQS